jgi:hypothetical protein
LMKSYVDSKQATVTGNFVLQPYSSRVLGS